MPVKMPLEDAIEHVLDALVQALEAEVIPGGKLDGVASIVRGDRARPRPDIPAIWVFAGAAQATHQPRTIAETWTMLITLACIYKSDDPETGYREATRLAARARGVAISDRTLGRRDIIQDVRSTRFEPSGPWHNEGTSFGAVAEISVIFVIME